MDETELIDRLKRGDPSALKEAWKQFHDQTYRLICSRVPPRIGWDESGAVRAVDDHEAQEILVDTFKSFFREIQKFRGESKISTWLYSIAANKIADFQRQRYRHPLISLATTKPHVPVEDEANTPDPSDLRPADQNNDPGNDESSTKTPRVSQKRRIIAGHEVVNWLSKSTDPADGLLDPRISLQTALGHLTERESDVITLRIIQEISIQKTAAILGISEGAVKMAQKRGIERLRKEFSELKNTEETVL